MSDCTEIRDRIPDLLSGRLTPEARTRVDAHLAGCAECREDVDTATWIGERAGRLPRSIAPARDLWTEIAPRLERRPRRFAVSVWSLAAAALVLIAVSSAATVALVRRTASPDPAGFAELEVGYQNAALELSGVYRRSRDSLAPETRAVLERNLDVIERALAEARAALDADPANRALEAVVVAAYKRKIEFLERASTLGAS
ncbi:MAG: zf-HC2 domain-containing protein [Gemmatimonadales bacterium]